MIKQLTFILKPLCVITKVAATGLREGTTLVIGKVLTICDGLCENESLLAQPISMYRVDECWEGEKKNWKLNF